MIHLPKEVTQTKAGLGIPHRFSSNTKCLNKYLNQFDVSERKLESKESPMILLRAPAFRDEVRDVSQIPQLYA